MVLVIPQFDDHELQSLKKHSNFCTFVMYTYIYRWWRNEMTDRTKKKKWYGRVPGGMQTLARSWISRRFGPQARFWHPFDISFPESCFTIQSSSPQPNGARVQNCAGIFEDVNIWMENWSAGNEFFLVRMVWVTTGTTMEAVFRKVSAVFAISKSLPEQLWGDSVLTGGS